ncbi:hypothetical protein Glove_162g9 [Diversispora epigaea]|uniref:Uncharacterized protein n=1 Tax=Diversispora epigaea TaxID=1348612 RepID=A0A397J0W0_9GLOM|nr:hypothetical protein Glove_162g9 [Diversispora epigaea]
MPFCNRLSVFNGPLSDYKFVINLCWQKKDFNDFIENIIVLKIIQSRLSDEKRGIKRSYMESLSNIPPPSKLGEPDEWVKYLLACIGTNGTVVYSGPGAYRELKIEYKELCEMKLLSSTFHALKKSLPLLDQYYDQVNKFHVEDGKPVTKEHDLVMLLRSNGY